MKFSYTKVEEYCNELQIILARMKSISDDYNNQIKKIKSGSVWAGPASEGFVQRGEKTKKMLDMMTENLQNSITYIRSCSANYKKLEETISGAISKKI